MSDWTLLRRTLDHMAAFHYDVSSSPHLKSLHPASKSPLLTTSHMKLGAYHPERFAFLPLLHLLEWCVTLHMLRVAKSGDTFAFQRPFAVPDINRAEHGQDIAETCTEIANFLDTCEFEMMATGALTKGSSSIIMTPCERRTLSMVIFSVDQCTLDPCTTCELLIAGICEANLTSDQHIAYDVKELGRFVSLRHVDLEMQAIDRHNQARKLLTRGELCRLDNSFSFLRSCAFSCQALPIQQRI